MPLGEAYGSVQRRRRLKARIRAGHAALCRGDAGLQCWLRAAGAGSGQRAQLRQRLLPGRVALRPRAIVLTLSVRGGGEHAGRRAERPSCPEENGFAHLFCGSCAIVALNVFPTSTCTLLPTPLTPAVIRSLLSSPAIISLLTDVGTDSKTSLFPLDHNEYNKIKRNNSNLKCFPLETSTRTSQREVRCSWV